MNKITVRNFFVVLLACLLIVIMMLIQIPSYQDKIPLTFTLGLIVMIASLIFILYQTITISNNLYKNNYLLEEKNKQIEQLKKELQQLTPKKEDKQTTSNN